MQQDMAGNLYIAVQRRRNRGLIGLYAVVGIFVLLYAWLFPGILSVSGFSKFTQNWFPLALVTMAQALLMLNGGITLAIGPLVSLGAVIAATTMGSAFGVFGGVAAVILSGFVIGALTGSIVAFMRLPAIIVTLAGSFIITGIALLILPRPGGYIPGWLSDFLAGHSPSAFIILVLVILGWKLFLATPMGLGIYAAGENPVGAYRSGVPVEKVKVISFALSGVLATCAGLFVAAQQDRAIRLSARPSRLIPLQRLYWAASAFLAEKARCAVPSAAAFFSP